MFKITVDCLLKIYNKQIYIAESVVYFKCPAVRRKRPATYLARSQSLLMLTEF